MLRRIDYPLFFLSFIPLAYIIKGALPFDLTLLIYILLYAMSTFSLIQKTHTIVFTKIDILFYVWALLMLLGSFYSPYTLPAVYKSAKFIFLALSLIFFTRLFIRNVRDMQRFLKYLFFNSTFTGYLVLFDYFTSGVKPSRYQAFGEIVPIPLAMLGAITLLMSIIMYFFREINLKTFLLSSFPSISLITIAASKGPVTALLITLIIMLPIFFRKINIKFVISIVVSMFLLTKVEFISQTLDNLIDRFISIDEDMSTVVRLDVYKDSISYFKASPFFGKGTSAAHPNYPHNFFLEILSENGLILFVVVLFLLLIFALQYFKFIKKKSHNYVEVIIFSIVIASLGSLMFSFTYVDHKYLFLSIGLLIVYNRLNIKNNDIIKRQIKRIQK